MRITCLLSIAATGCIISEPEGTPQYWPPQLGGTVEAVVAGDLDANGSTDIVAMMTGEETQAGLYFFESDVDILWEDSDKISTFSRFVPASFEHPVAAYLDAGVAPRVYVVSGDGLLSVDEITNNLSVAGGGVSTVPGGTNAWIRPIMFPGAMEHWAVSNGAQIDHLDSTLDDPRPLPPPMGSPSWDLAQTVTSYADGTDQIAFVATAQNVYRVTIPTMPGAPFAWEPFRTGPPLLGQTVVDLDGDGRDEILGYDAMSHSVCAVELSPVFEVDPSCIPLMTDFTGTDITIIAGTNLSQEPLDDILVAQASGSDTRYTLVKEVTYISGVLETMMLPFEIPKAGPPRGRSVLATPAPGRPYSVLTFGTDGTVVCALGPAPC